MITERQKERRAKQAETYANKRQHGKAIEVYQGLVVACPGDDSFLLALAWAYHDAGNVEEALHCFEQLFQRELSRSVFTGFAYDELVRFYKSNGRHDRLVRICEQAAEAQPQDSALLRELVLAYRQAGMVGEAKKACRKLLAMDFEATGLCLLGEIHLDAGEFAAAEKAHGKAARLEPEAAGTFYSRLAEGCRQRGAYGHEEKILRKCLRMHRNDPQFLCRLGNCRIRKGNPLAARDAYEKAIELLPDSAAAFYHRWGTALATAGYHREAVAVFQKALAEGKQHPLSDITMKESCSLLEGKAERS